MRLNHHPKCSGQRLAGRVTSNYGWAVQSGCHWWLAHQCPIRRRSNSGGQATSGTRHLTSHRTHVIATVILIGLLTGCAHSSNPWRDDLPATETATTASVQIARGVIAEGTRPDRGFVQLTITPTSGAVTHGPSYWPDPYEDRGSDDGQFRWTGEDYWAAYYGIGCNLVNTVLMPLSAVLTPPDTVMVSDGVSERQWLGHYRDPERLSDRKTESIAPGPSEL